MVIPSSALLVFFTSFSYLIISPILLFIAASC
nr:MAG TPA: hypothetical protein [Caudoviricetes sp.]